MGNFGKIIKKVRSKNGATILFALLFFIMCAVIGSIVLSSATGVVGQLATLKKDSREYYAVSSLERYISDSISNAEFTSTVKKTETYSSNSFTATSITYSTAGDEGVGIVEVGADPLSNDSLLLGKLKTCFENYFVRQDTDPDNYLWRKNFYYSGHDVADGKKYHVSIDGYNSLSGIFTVQMDKFGGLVFKIYQSDDSSYILQLTAKPLITTDETSEYNSEADESGDGVTRLYTTVSTTTIKYLPENIEVKKVHTK